MDARQYNTPNGAYYKDLNNELDKFVGTWKFTDGNKELIIELGKIEQLQISNNYRDYLRGEYSYIENNSTLVNTLPLNLNEKANLGGSYIYPPNRVPKCNSCSSNERRVNMYFKDPERKYLDASIMLRYIVGSNPPQMMVKIYNYEMAIVPDGASNELRVPYGTYLMTKQ
ncbi:hypothetical protein WH52_13150 [Tenacibaculum holothuriorum]|uniref:DUF6705 domain-containing protein n=1 Tax=Tenacibaculum holothuriorum TaxID=1635173 RepID=A0A1Y2PBA8_9FLAO|nr:hypothetical protein WH52_13150 [Tenacibaculum holothuriorum]